MHIPAEQQAHSSFRDGKAGRVHAGTGKQLACSPRSPKKGNGGVKTE